MLTDGQIRAYLEEGELGITMLRHRAIQPCSVDLHLGAQMKKQNKTGFGVSLQNPPSFDVWDASESWWLYPGHFYLGHTSEEVHLPDYLVGELHGKSSWGRLGLQVHSTAGHIDPGFYGQITLEISVNGVEPIELKFGDPIAQICFTLLTEKVQRPYGDPELDSHYQGQQGAMEVVARA